MHIDVPERSGPAASINLDADVIRHSGCAPLRRPRRPASSGRPLPQQRKQSRLVMPMKCAWQILRPKRQGIGNDELEQGIHGVFHQQIIYP